MLNRRLAVIRGISPGLGHIPAIHGDREKNALYFRLYTLALTVMDAPVVPAAQRVRRSVLPSTEHVEGWHRHPTLL